VLVIGAGAGGLAAAHRLRQAEVPVTVLEARDRLGGRVHTDDSPAAPLELGAAWIHGSEGNPLIELAERAGVSLARADHRPAHAYEGSLQPSSDLGISLLQTHLPDWLAQARRVAHEAREDLSLADALGRAPAAERWSHKQRAWVLHWFTLIMGADPEQLSARHWDQDTDLPGEDRVPLAGYERLLRPLSEGLEIRYGEPVREIRWSDAGVAVLTDDQTHHAAAAIVTLPLGVLKAGHVRFQPALPAGKRQAIQRLGMGVLDKVILVYESPFWPNDEHLSGLGHQPDGIRGFTNLHHYGGPAALVGWIAGRGGIDLARRSDAALVDRARRALGRILGRQIPAPMAARVTRWGRDRFAFGSYSHIPPGASGEDYDRLAAPAGPTLLFAGEATHRAHPATVHGAYLAGRREAERLI